ncbi:Hypothetical protein R9X50_00326500 [Acrodontium crateriforme]|uniref:DNA polymerase epsilon subunit B n=1 Tax=Acrodontium crateriforme TaxID=150365 RepID=A0AAQ3R9B0_9PEZI|nr:Hypothetical protein R9X50_00326500 [Acrodontium crateriforme]
MDSLRRPPDSNTFSSSPAFATPLHPLPSVTRAPPPPPPAFNAPAVSAVLPVLLPPPTLRPLAFRTFTKKHNLTLNALSLQALATFIGKHCGSGWREEGTGERVLDEAAKLWKAENGAVIVEDGPRLKAILATLESCMVGGKIGPTKTGRDLSRQNSFAFGKNDSAVDLNSGGIGQLALSRQSSIAQGQDAEEQDDASTDPRAWLKVVSAFEQPRLRYDMERKHFVQLTNTPSLFPPASNKTALLRERYNIIYQRLLRNEAFQAPTFSTNMPSLTRSDSTTAQQFYKITPIANLLGRGGSTHLLLGMLVIAPTGTLALNDLSGSISLDLQHAQPLQGVDSAFFVPGMIVLVDGVYEEDWSGVGSSGLGSTGGVGGTIGGRFLGFSIGGPPVEKRDVSLGINLSAGDVGGGGGWTDFLGLGSERAVGGRMRRLEQRLLGPESLHASESRRKTAILSEVALDQPSTLVALRTVLEQYAARPDPPLSFILTGNFCSHAVMAGAGTGSIEYKELFNELASVLSDFPSLLRSSTWIFVPGDNDPWSSAFSAGASVTLPRSGVPDIFTSRIRRAFTSAKSEVGIRHREGEMDGEAIWTSNPTRVSLFGPAHELLVMRDDISGRFRRSAIRIGQAIDSSGDLGPSGRQDAAIDIDSDNDTPMMTGALPSTEQELAALPAVLQADSFTTASAKKTILSLLPQATLSPFPFSIRPVNWDRASSALSLHPLPHTLVLADAEADAYVLTFEGCHVLNPGRLVPGGAGSRKGGKVQWVEYDCWTKRGTVMEGWSG